MSFFRAVLLLFVISLPTFAVDCFRDVCVGDEVHVKSDKLVGVVSSIEGHFFHLKSEAGPKIWKALRDDFATVVKELDGFEIGKSYLLHNENLYYPTHTKWFYKIINLFEDGFALVKQKGKTSAQRKTMSLEKLVLSTKEFGNFQRFQNVYISQRGGQAYIKDLFENGMALVQDKQVSLPYLVRVIRLQPYKEVRCKYGHCVGEYAVYKSWPDNRRSLVKIHKIIDAHGAGIQVKFSNGRIQAYHDNYLFHGVENFDGFQVGSHALYVHGPILVKVDHLFETGDSVVTFPDGTRKFLDLQKLWRELEENLGFRAGDRVLTRGGMETTIIGVFENNQAVFKGHEPGSVWYDNMAGLQKL